MTIGTFQEGNKLHFTQQDREGLNASTTIGIENGYFAAKDYLDAFEEDYRCRAEFPCNDAERSILVFRLSSTAYKGASSQDVLDALAIIFQVGLFSHSDLIELSKRALSYARDHNDKELEPVFSSVVQLFQSLLVRSPSLSLGMIRKTLCTVSGFEPFIRPVD